MSTKLPRSSDPARGSSAYTTAPSSSPGKFRAVDDGGNLENGGSSRMTLDGFLRTVGTSAPPPEPTLMGGAQIFPAAPRRTVDDVWREIVSGERRTACKQEVPDEEMMTLEDFLVRAGVSVEEEEEEEEEEEAVEVKDVKLLQPLPPAHQLSSSSFALEPKLEPFMGGFGNEVEAIGSGGYGLRGKRASSLLEPLDKAAQQRQRRMIKNRESAARSRERKQAYQEELESLAMKLEEENARLLKEKAERTKERHKQLMERLVPIAEKPKSARVFRRVRSMQW